MAEVKLENITKSFGKVRVIHGIDTRIEDGEFMVIVGPSGCGKSTLLRLIAGLEQVTGGSVSIGDRVVNDLEPKDRDIAMVFQNYALYPHMSVFDNMAYGLKLRKFKKSEIQKRVDQAAELLQLEGLLQRKPKQLSGGQRQRVAMGRCIVRDPKVFLFDEPLSNLDAKLRVQMRLELRKLHERLKVTSVYVTHDQVEAMTLGDRLIVMDDGYAVQIGTPLEIYEQPATLFVAGFIGSPAMNFIQGQVGGDGETITIQSGDRFPVFIEKDHPLKAGSEVVLGIRPEHFYRTDEASALCRLQVTHIEIIGADTLVYGHLGVPETDVTVRLSDVNHMERGATLPLTVTAEKLHLFDPETGRRV